MKYTVVGDPHAKHENLDKIKNLQEYVEALKKPTIWLGDMLETKEVIRGKCLNAWRTYYKASELRHLILVGNHDWFDDGCEEHSLESLKDLDNVTIIDKPTYKDDFLLLPYMNDTAKIREVLKQEGAEDKILIMHQGIIGFDYGNGKIATGEGRGEINLRDIESFKKVISGHFHKFDKKSNLVFLGTPFSHSFGESNQRKYIGVLDTDTAKLKLIETEFPRHITITVNCEGSAEPDLQGHEEDYVRVILEGSEEAVNKFNKDNYPGIIFIERPEEGPNSEQALEETISNELKFKKYAEEIKGWDKDMIDLGISILESTK